MRPVCFTWAGTKCGFRRCLPLGVSVFAYGLVFGILAVQAGLSAVQAGAMSLTTFAGLFLISRIRPTPRVEAFLRHVPASILVAIIVPGLVRGSPAELGAAGVTAVVAASTRNLLAGLCSGVLAVLLFRSVF